MNKQPPLINQVRQYLKQQGYYRYTSKAATKKVFRQVLTSFLAGEISADFLSGVSDELLYTTLTKKGEIDLKLLTALNRASSLNSAWLASERRVLSEQLRFYLNHQFSQ